MRAPGNRSARRRAFLWSTLFPLVASAAAASGGTAQTASTANRRVEGITVPGFHSAIAGRWQEPDETQSGVPLGGLGTGYLEVRPDARIHDSQFRLLGPVGECPSLRLSVKIGSATEATLLASAGLKGPAPARHRYLGHFPIIDLDFAQPTPAPVSVWCRAYSPFVVGASVLSNTPAALFTVRMKSNAAAPIFVSVRLFWLAHSDSKKATTLAGTARDVTGLLLRSKDLTYGVVAKGNGWTARPIGSTGVEVSGRIPAKAEKNVTFAISWHAPLEAGRDGKELVPHYVDRFADAGEAAHFALLRSAEIESRIVAWQEKTYAGAGPDWLKDAMVNSLYLLVRNTVWFGDGLYLAEQQGRIVESVGSRLDGGTPIAQFFPDLEKAALLRLASRQAESGEIPGRLGQEGAFGAPAYGIGRTSASAEFALLCRRYELTSGDRAFLRDVFPAMKRAIQFAMTLDTDHDGLLDELPVPRSLAALDRYRRDWLWYGKSAYHAFLGLAALRAGEVWANSAGDREFADWCRERFESGRSGIENTFWNGRIFRLYTDPDGFRQSDSSFIAALAAQGWAWQLGLGELSDVSRLEAALEAAATTHGRDSDAEAPSGIRADGAPDESGAPYATATVPRDLWLFASTAVLATSRSGGIGLKERALDIAKRAYDAMTASGTLWKQYSLYEARDLKPSGDVHYFGNLAIWTLQAALDSKPAKP